MFPPVPPPVQPAGLNHASSPIGDVLIKPTGAVITPPPEEARNNPWAFLAGYDFGYDYEECPELPVQGPSSTAPKSAVRPQKNYIWFDFDCPL